MAPRLFARTRATIACALSLTLVATPALAATSKATTLQQRGNELLARVKETTQSYQDAESQLKNLAELIAQNEQTVADITAHLPEQRARTASSIKTLYKFQQNSPGLIDLILSAESLSDFISTVYYIDSITDRNTAEITALTDLHDQLVQTQASLEAERDAVQATQDDAQDALEQALAIRKEVTENAKEIAQMDSEDRAQVIAAAQAAQAIIDAAEANGTTVTAVDTDSQSTSSDSKPAQSDNASTTQQATTDTATSDTKPATTDQSASKPAESTTPAEPTPAPAEPTPAPAEPTLTPEPAPAETTTPTTSDTSSDTNWADRINAYLEGTSLEGYGEQFAQAAETYGVDPRIAPAIAGVESGWGQVCFRDHNAWGWGSQSWDSWDQAIDSYVSGYSDIYGSTVTLEGAEMYAANDIYDVWYDTVLSEMDSI